MNTLEGNKIPVFLGWEYNSEPITGRSFIGWYKPHSNQVKFKGHFTFVGDNDRLKFHTSWDWLMPVVEKIESMGFEVTLYKRKAVVSDNGFKNSFEDIIMLGNDRLTSIYRVALEFIQWYNTQQ